MSDTDTGRAWTDSLKVKPTALIGFAMAIGYAVLFLVLEKFIGPPYTEIGKTADSILRGIVIPLAICAVVTAGLTTWLGWWRPSSREAAGREVDVGDSHRTRLAWCWSAIDWAQITALSGTYLLLLAIGTLLVGFNEEIVYRGLSLVAFRGAYKEVYVWLATSILFGLLHGANVFLGQALVPTMQQIGFAFVLGSVFYVVRRVTGKSCCAHDPPRAVGLRLVHMGGRVCSHQDGPCGCRTGNGLGRNPRGGSHAPADRAQSSCA